MASEEFKAALRRLREEVPRRADEKSPEPAKRRPSGAGGTGAKLAPLLARFSFRVDNEWPFGDALRSSDAERLTKAFPSSDRVVLDVQRQTVTIERECLTAHDELADITERLGRAIPHRRFLKAVIELLGE